MHAVRARRLRSSGGFAALRRYLRYHLVVPILRSRHSPEFTARGVANGVFWGLTPTLGVQTIAICTTWFLARRVCRRDSSVVQALLWSWVNNPFTMIPMFYLFYLTGLLLMGTPGLTGGYDTFVAHWNTATSEPQWLPRVSAVARALGLPTVVGSIPYAVAGSWLSYRWALRIVTARQRRLRRAGGIE